MHYGLASVGQFANPIICTLLWSNVRTCINPEEDSQDQKVLIIKLHPEDFNWIPFVYSSFSISYWSHTMVGSTWIGDTKGRVDEWTPIKVLRMQRWKSSGCNFMINFWPWLSSSGAACRQPPSSDGANAEPGEWQCWVWPWGSNWWLWQWTWEEWVS